MPKTKRKQTYNKYKKMTENWFNFKIYLNHKVYENTNLNIKTTLKQVLDVMEKFELKNK